MMGLISGRDRNFFSLPPYLDWLWGPSQHPIEWLPGTLSPGVKWLGDHSPPSSAEVKNAQTYTSIPLYVFMAWSLVKHRNSFIFTLPNKIGYSI